MTLRLALSVSLLVLSLSACDKHDAESHDKTTATTPTPLAATKVSDVALASAEPAPARPPAAAETAKAEGMSCGNAEMADGKCAGEGGKEGGEEGGCSQWDAEAAKVAKRETPAGAVWTTIPVAGMTCGGCERRVVASLGGVDGILGVEADAELGQVRVAYAKGNDKMAEDAKSRIKALGYKPE